MIKSLFQSLLQGGKQTNEEYKSSSSRSKQTAKNQPGGKQLSGYAASTPKSGKESTSETFNYKYSTPRQKEEDSFNDNLLPKVFKLTTIQEQPIQKNIARSEVKESSATKKKRLSINPNDAMYANQSMEFGKEDISNEQTNQMPRKCIDFRSINDFNDEPQIEITLDKIEAYTSSTNFSGSLLENQSQVSAAELTDHLRNGKQNKKKKVVKKKKYKDYNLKYIDADKFFQNEANILTENEWCDIISGNKELKMVSKDRIRQSLFKGLPEYLRGEIWCLLCNDGQQFVHDKNVYKKLVKENNHNEEYQISKDIHRTLPELELFKEDLDSGENKLFNVLKAYAIYDNEIGYVQGMNYLAAILLIHINDEEKAFWCLVHLLHRKNWRMIYDNNTPKLMNLLDLLKERMAKEDPAMLRHLEREDVSMVAAFSPIFITLYIYQIPVEYAKRIFEYFIFEGETALMKVLFKMLSLKRKEILKKQDHELLQFFRTDMVQDCIKEFGIEALINY